MEVYKGDFNSAAEAKLAAVTAVLATLGIKIKDEFGIIYVSQNGKGVARIDILTSIKNI